jgi:hypothetical protein
MMGMQLCSFVKYAFGGLMLATAVVGCASDDAMPAPPPDTMPAPPLAAAAPDLRFQWVPLPSASYPQVAQFAEPEQTNFGDLVSLSTTGPSMFSPMSIGGSGDWLTFNFGPVAASGDPAIEDLQSAADSGGLGGLDQRISDVQAAGYVITSLDTSLPGAVPTPISGPVYGMIETRPVSDSSAHYTGTEIVTARGELDAAVARAAQAGEVATALAGDGTTLRVVMSGRLGDHTAYDTEVVDATAATLLAQATALASAGYVITAFGRDGDGGALLLIGTRPPVPAGTQPTSYTIVAESSLRPPSLTGHPGGLIARLFDPSLPNDDLELFEYAPLSP